MLLDERGSLWQCGERALDRDGQVGGSGAEPLEEVRPVTAVELDETMLAAAKGAAQDAGDANITFIQGDAMEVGDLIDGKVDLVLIANTFHGAPDHTGLARAVRQTLDPGGTFVVVNWWPKPREETVVLGKPRGPRPELRFSPEEVAGWVEPAGFELDRVEEVGPYHYGAVFAATREGGS